MNNNDLANYKAMLQSTVNKIEELEHSLEKFENTCDDFKENFYKENGPYLGKETEKRKAYLNFFNICKRHTILSWSEINPSNVKKVTSKVVSRIEFLKKRTELIQDVIEKINKYNTASGDKKSEAMKAVNEAKKNLNLSNRNGISFWKDCVGNKIYNGYARANNGVTKFKKLLAGIPSAGLKMGLAVLTGSLISGFVIGPLGITSSALLTVVEGLSYIVPSVIALYSHVKDRNKIKNDELEEKDKKPTLTLREYNHRLSIIKGKDKEKENNLEREAPALGAQRNAQSIQDQENQAVKINTYDGANQLYERLKNGSKEFIDIKLLDKALDFLNASANRIGFIDRKELSEDQRKIVDLRMELRKKRDEINDALIKENKLLESKVDERNKTSDGITTYKQFEELMANIKADGDLNDIPVPVFQAKQRELEFFVNKSQERYEVFNLMYLYNNECTTDKQKNNCQKRLFELYKGHLANIRELAKNECDYNELIDKIIEFESIYANDTKNIIDANIKEAVNTKLAQIMFQRSNEKEQSQQQQNTR